MHASHILWQTGATTELTISKQMPGRRTSEEATMLIAKLVRENKPAPEIAAHLNENGLLTAEGALWSNIAVHQHCRYRGLRWSKRMPSSVKRPERRPDGLYSVRGVARRLGVSENAVRHWIQRGWLKITDGGSRGRPCWFRLDDLVVRRLTKLREAHTRANSRLQSLAEGDAS